MPCFPPPPRQIPFGILAFQNFSLSAFSATPMSKNPAPGQRQARKIRPRPLLAFSIYPSAFLPPPPAFARPGHCQWQPTNSHKTFVCQKKLRNNGAGTARPRLFRSRSDCPTVAVRLQPTARSIPKAFRVAARRLPPAARPASFRLLQLFRRRRVPDGRNAALRRPLVPPKQPGRRRVPAFRFFPMPVPSSFTIFLTDDILYSSR